MLVHEVCEIAYPAKGRSLDIFIIPPNGYEGIRACNVYVDPARGVIRHFYGTTDTKLPYHDDEVDFLTVEGENELWVWV